jgi:uncharacterized protein YkwD
MVVRKVLVVFTLVFCVGLTAAPAPARPSRAEADLLRAVNQTRAQYGLAPVHVDPTLERAARAHSAAMLRSGSFGHGDFARRLTSFGARGPAVGENLAWGVGSRGTPAGVIQGWLASPSHRANLLRPGFRRIGIGRIAGTYRGHGGAAVITADFAGV